MPACGSGFLARTLTRFAQLFENELYCERYSSNNKLLQSLDPRVKVVVILAFMAGMRYMRWRKAFSASASRSIFRKYIFI